MIDLDGYLARLGLGERPELAALHRAHVCSIPFENLDPHRGVPVSLAPEALERKLVAARRGGYCFEQNLLLGAALEALGARVERLLARVRWQVAPGTPTPRTHLVLRVQLDGTRWHADAGFGGGTLLEPIPFGVGGPYEQAGWRFRVVEEGEELVLQTETCDGWRDVYAIDPGPVPAIDIELSNWFTATHPASRFVTGLIVTAQRPDGTRLALSDWNGLAFVVRTPDEAMTRRITRAEIPRLLEVEFGLPGFRLDGAGRVAAADRR